MSEIETGELKSKRAGRRKGGNLFWLILIILIVATFVGWKYWGGEATPVPADQAAAAGQTAVDPKAEEAAKKEIASLVKAAGKLILLPVDEEPTVATVLDASKLIAEQAFYQGAENGDKLLVYAKAQKAILYSPSRKILINVGPVYFNEDQAATSAATDKSETPAATTTED